MADPKLNKQIILRGNTAVVQEVFETEIGDVGDILKKAYKEDHYQFLPLGFPALHKGWAQQTILGSTPNGDTLLSFTQINYFPMADTWLKRAVINGERKDHYLFSGNPKDAEGNVTQASYENYFGGNTDLEDDDFIKLETSKWDFHKEYTAWVMIPFNNGQIKTPYIFVTDTDHNPFIPNLPNVHGGGDICTGGTYRYSLPGTTHVLQKIQSGLNCIHDAPPNNDLRNVPSEYATVQWDKDGNTLETTPHADFYRGATDERIIEFVKWMKTKGPVS